jgi:glycerol-3-phosphate dehydrogenase
MARTVDDVFGRRMWALFLDARAALEMAPRVAGLMAEEMGHDDAWVTDQVMTFTENARGYVYTDVASTHSATTSA